MRKEINYTIGSTEEPGVSRRNLEWERSWRNVKILKFPARYAEELRRGVRVNPTIEQILVANVMLPDVDTTRELLDLDRYSRL